MRALILPPLLAACTSLPADTSRAERDLADALRGRTAGAPVTCVSQSMLSGPQIIDDKTLVYTQSGRRVWVNTLPADCPSLRRDSILIVRVFGAQSCENDLFQTRDPGGIIPGPICRLGKFTPYDKPKQ